MFTSRRQDQFKRLNKKLSFLRFHEFLENIFTIRSYEVTNKTIDSFSDIDDFTNSKNMSNFNMSNIFDNLKEKEKSLANRKLISNFHPILKFV